MTDCRRRRRPIRTTFLAATLAAAAGALALLTLTTRPVLADPGVVTTRDKRTFTGDVTESPERVTILSHGVETVIDRADVLTVTFVASLDEQYEQRLNKLANTDVPGRVDLARWAFNAHRYDLAEDALDLALALDPKSVDAADFRNLVRNQQRLELAKQAATRRAATEAAASTEPAVQLATPDAPRRGAAGARIPGASVPKNYLSPDEINRIRQAELKPTDRGVKVRFDNEVRQRYATAANIPIQRFYSWDSATQAQRIIADPDESFRADVVIASDPPALVEFRTRILPTVLNGCATSGCHGSPGAGDFFLFDAPRTNEPAAYTDFYLLVSYVKTIDTGGGRIFGGATQRRMIDRIRPHMSLLLQYALPQDLADIDHPAVRGFKPLLKSSSDPRYRDIVDWIRTALTPIEPHYDIDYAPPLDTTAPAREPAQAPAPELPATRQSSLIDLEGATAGRSPRFRAYVRRSDPTINHLQVNRARIFDSDTNRTLTETDDAIRRHWLDQAAERFDGEKNQKKDE